MAAVRLAVYIGTFIAYKHSDRPRGPSETRRKTMAAKKKSTKSLQKAKKLQPTKSLAVHRELLPAVQ